MKNVAFLAAAVLALGLAGCGSKPPSIDVPGASPAPVPETCDFGVDAQTMKCVVPEDPNKVGQGRTN